MYFLASDAAKSITGVNIPVDQVLRAPPAHLVPASFGFQQQQHSSVIAHTLAFIVYSPRGPMSGQCLVLRVGLTHASYAACQGWACGAIGNPNLPEPEA